MNVLKKSFIVFLLLIHTNIFFSQSVIIEGRGFESLTLGIKENKVVDILGNTFKRTDLGNGFYNLEYIQKGITIGFDKNKIVDEIIFEPSSNFITSKGLKLRLGLKVSDIESIYGEDWWTCKGCDYFGYDIGIRFETSNNTIEKIIIEQSDLDEGNDYSFYEYLNGEYIPENLNKCFDQLNSMLTTKEIEEIKIKTEEDFTANSHFGLGLWIRNNWGLWQGSRLYHFFKIKGISHPDDMSGIILTSYHRKINGIEIQLEEQIMKYQEYWEKQKKE